MSEEVERLREENERLSRRLAELEGPEPSTAAFLESVLQAVPAFIMRADPELKIRYINHVQPGLNHDEVIGSSLMDFVLPGYEDTAKKAFERALGGQPERYDTAAPGPHGTTGHYECYVTPVPESDGRNGICLVALEVTEHHERAGALQESEQKLRVALDAASIGLWSWNLQTGEVVWDDRMREVTGVDEPVATEEWIERLVHPDDRERVAHQSQKAVETGRIDAQPHRIVRPDGAVRWVLLTGKMVADGRRMIGGILDVTSQQELEAQLRHAQKMEAVGNLTAGVAHNFNNLLMAILPTMDLLKSELPPAQHELLDDARFAAERGAQLVRELMTFAGQRRSSARMAVDPKDLVTNAVAICRSTFDPSIGVELEVASDLSRVDCDVNAIEHTLVNVLLNARDAIADIDPARRRIQVAVRHAEEPDLEGLLGATNGRFVVLEVSDRGPGMDDATRRQIFQPFFTTKGPQGTGLGLSTAYAVVNEHGGHIVCLSSPGSGTTFRILLPVAPGAEQPEAVSPRKNEAPRILVVDDENAVRRVVERILEGAGFEVTAVADREQAQEALDAGQRFDLALLDRGMPESPQTKLIPLLRDRCPKAKLVYFTGQHIDVGAAGEVDAVVQKPVSRDELIAATRRLLGPTSLMS